MIEEYCDNGKRLWWLKKIVIIRGYYDYWKELWWLEGIMIIEKYYNKKEEIKKMVIKSSIVNEIIRGNFKLFFFFFYDKILQAPKAQKDA